MSLKPLVEWAMKEQIRKIKEEIQKEGDQEDV